MEGEERWPFLSSAYPCTGLKHPAPFEMAVTSAGGGGRGHLGMAAGCRLLNKKSFGWNHKKPQDTPLSPHFPRDTPPPSSPPALFLFLVYMETGAQRESCLDGFFFFFVSVKSRTPESRCMATALVLLIITSNCYNGSHYHRGSNIHLTK